MGERGTRVIDRDQAVRDVANSLAGRDDFVIVTPPHAVAELAARLPLLPVGWTAYIDNGLPMTMVTDVPAAMELPALLSPVAAVVTVPKAAAPAALLTDVLGEEVPEGGSQDLILLHGGENEPIVWPMLFVDALHIVDPAAARQITEEASGSA